MPRLPLIAALTLLAGCTAAPPAMPAATAAPASIPTPTLTPTRSPAAPAAATPPPEPTDPAWEVCSPLAGVPLASLPGRVTNPFAPPPPGSDDPHQGVDFADFLPNTQIAIAGLPIPAALPGTVALVIYDRFPWGNALIIETHLENPPPPFALPTPFPQIPLHTNLTCPGVTDFGWDASRRSLYLLYAHMQSAPALQPGEAVACGQELGAIGDTGNALNPHLHLEARLGPAGARFGGMAHYTGSATPAEQDAYCAWRVSGWFQLVNPLTLFGEGE